MPKHFFYIESYVYSILLDKKLLLYNTFSYSSLVFEFTSTKILDIIREIFLIGSGRIIEINDLLNSNPEFVDFVGKCKYLLMGDLIQCDIAPFVLDFKPKINSDNRKLDINGNWESLNIRNSLQELNFVINNPKTLCENDSLLENGIKQILFPCCVLRNNENVLMSNIEKYLKGIDISRFTQISVIGDIFQLNDYESFIYFFKNNNIKISLYYKDLSENYFSKISNLDIENIGILIWVDQIVDFNQIEQLINFGIQAKIPTSFMFVISDENELQYVENKLSNMTINFSVVPFYKKTNLAFFEEYVYNDKSVILNQELKDRNLVSRMYINQLYYGKLFIFPNGDIHSNPNLNKLGNLNSGFLIDVLKQVNLDAQEGWLMTRNKVSPCDDCVYQFLCGPVSNYEYSIGKMNLCWYNPYLNKWKGESGYEPVEKFYKLI